MSETFPFIKNRPFDLISMGRVAVDLYSEQYGSKLEHVQTFRKYLGGCAGNIAVGTSRLGLKSVMLSCVGTDAMGTFVKQTLEKENVNTCLLTESKDHLTGLVLLGVNPPDNFPLIFYRENCADMKIEPSDCHREIFEKTKALLITGTGLSTPEMRETTNFAVDLAKEVNTAVIIDLDFRPVLWGLTERGDGEKRFFSSQEVTQHYQSILSKCDLIVGTEKEILIAGGHENLTSSLNAIQKFTQATIIVKKGVEGCDIYNNGIHTPISFPGFPVEVLNVIGAGDAFMSGLLRGWLRREKWEISAQYANAAGAIVVSRHACSPATPNFEEVEYFIRHYRAAQQMIEDPYFVQLHNRVSRRFDNKKDIFILAFDHRWQFEQSCEEVGRARNLISAFKSQVFSGFKMAKQNNKDKHLAILIDPIYGEEVLKESSYLDIQVGVPIEAAGSFPVQWLGEQPLYQQILHRPENWFVKVLWKYHPSMETGLKLRQLSQLQQLSSVCQALNRRLMVELVMPSSFNSEGKDVAQAIEEVYQHRIYPLWWKIAPVKTLSEWQALTDICFYYDPTTRIILLGGSSSANQNWSEHFASFKKTNLAKGFAFGRNIFWEPWQRVLAGELSLEEVPQEIAARFSTYIDIWEGQKEKIYT